MNILAIDLGSYSIKTAIVKASGGQLELLSLSSVPTSGIRQGKVTSMDKASFSIACAINKVKENISVRIDKTVVSVNAAYLKTYSSRSKLVLESGATISIHNIKKALENAYNQTALSNVEVALHVLPWRFYASNGTIVEDPLGMCSSAFALEAHVIAINQDDLSNLRRILELAGVDNYELVAGIYATSIYALRDEEKERCTAIIDIGHEICQLAVYKQNSIAWLDSLRFGSGLISDDLVKVLRLQEDMAKRLKIEHVNYQDSDNVAVSSQDGGEEVLNMEIIRKIINMRINEMLDSSHGLLRESEYGKEYSSVVFAGGTFNAQQMKDRAKPKFDNMAVRVQQEAHPCFLPSDCEAFLLPEYSCMFGLCMYGAGYCTNYELNVDGELKTYQKINPLAAANEVIDASEHIAPELNLAHSFDPEEQMHSEEKSAFARLKDKALDKLTRLF